MGIKHFKRQLASVMVMTLVGSMAFAPSIKAAEATTTAVAAEQTEKEAYREKTMADYSEEKCIKDLLENGVKIDQRVIRDGIIVHFERMIADSYSYRILCSIEKEDHTAFDDYETVRVDNFLFDTPQSIAELITQDNRSHITLADFVKAEVDKDPNLKQFINEAGTVNEVEARKYYEGKLKANDATDEDEDTSSFGTNWGACQANSTDKRIYVLLEGSKNLDSEVLKEGRIYLDSIITERLVVETPAVDILTYLKEHPESPKTEKNPQKEKVEKQLEVLKAEDMASYELKKKSYENIPELSLSEGKLNLAVTKGDTDQRIDNIGFIDGKLHISILRETRPYDQSSGKLEIVDAKGEPIRCYSWHRREKGEVSNISKEYLVFDIADIEALSQCKVKLVGYKDNVIATGPWMISTKVTEGKQVTKTINQEVEYGTQGKINLKEVTITPLSILFTFDGFDKVVNKKKLPFTVMMKDGTTYEFDYENADKKDGDCYRAVYLFPSESINPEEVVSITMGGKVIKLD